MARKCAFCKSEGVTLEHVIPQWVSRRILNATGGTGFRVGDNLRMPKGRQSNIIDHQVRRVCEKCNGGWMHHLETEAQPILSAMMDGYEVTMYRSEQTTVAKWALKTAMMVEFLTPARQFAQEDRTYLAERSEIPDGHTVFLAVFTGQAGFASYAPLRYGTSLGETTLSASTFGIDHLICQVIGSGKVGGWVIDVEHDAANLEAAIQVWPIIDDVVGWPPKFVLDETQLAAFVRMPLPPD